MSAEVIPALTESEARRLTERIRAALDRVSTAWSDLAERVTEAYERRADLALGYGSWAEYAEAELRPPSQLAAEVRRELVGLLSAKDMSVRAIAPVVGTDFSTVSRDRAKVLQAATPAQDRADWAPEDHAEQDDLDATDDLIDFATGEVLTDQRGGTEPPSPVTDVEEQETGPQQPPAPRPATIGLDGKTYPRPEPSAPKRKPLPDQFWTVLYDTERRVEALRRLIDDDRFAANRQAISDRNLAAAKRTASTFAEVLAAMENVHTI